MRPAALTTTAPEALRRKAPRKAPLVRPAALTTTAPRGVASQGTAEGAVGAPGRVDSEGTVCDGSPARIAHGG
jgi:hypothetical protein